LIPKQFYVLNCIVENVENVYIEWVKVQDRLTARWSCSHTIWRWFWWSNHSTTEVTQEHV